ncbi:hypothetical protein AURDEDRAFT_173782 [Auricularia subglabra TFB-10046 SS5]|nr:hypothetical protein AURDEDRAFT_173782 [Auricularia subglabra TFB-10046 SS5]
MLLVGSNTHAHVWSPSRAAASDTVSRTQRVLDLCPSGRTSSMAPPLAPTTSKSPGSDSATAAPSSQGDDSARPLSRVFGLADSFSLHRRPVICRPLWAPRASPPACAGGYAAAPFTRAMRGMDVLRQRAPSALLDEVFPSCPTQSASSPLRLPRCSPLASLTGAARPHGLGLPTHRRRAARAAGPADGAQDHLLAADAARGRLSAQPRLTDPRPTVWTSIPDVGGRSLDQRSCALTSPSAICLPGTERRSIRLTDCLTQPRDRYPPAHGLQPRATVCAAAQGNALQNGPETRPKIHPGPWTRRTTSETPGGVPGLILKITRPVSARPRPPSRPLHPLPVAELAGG